MVVWLIDISNHQGSFDVGRAVSEGYAGVWMKATEGRAFRDGLFDGFADQVLAAGAVPGAYHFLRAGDGREQCDVFYNRMRDHGGPDGWLAACDNEADASWKTTVDFFARWRELAGDHPLFMYSGNWWWSERGWDGASLTPYLWDSRYVSGVDYGSRLYGKVPESWWSSRYGGWGDVTVLQFSSWGSVAGRLVDVNAFRGSVDDLRALTSAGAATGGDLTTDGDDDVVSLMKFDPMSEIFLTDGVTARHVQSPEEVSDLQFLGREGTINLGFGGEVRVVTRQELVGRIVGDVPAGWEAYAATRPAGVVISDEQIAALATALAPVVPSAAAVADAVVDEEASRLAG